MTVPLPFTLAKDGVLVVYTGRVAIVAVAIFAVGVPLADLALTLGPVAISSDVDRLKHAWYRDWFNSYGIMLEKSFAKKRALNHILV